MIRGFESKGLVAPSIWYLYKNVLIRGVNFLVKR